MTRRLARQGTKQETVLEASVGNGKKQPSRQRIRETSDKSNDEASNSPRVLLGTSKRFSRPSTGGRSRKGILRYCGNERSIVCRNEEHRRGVDSPVPAGSRDLGNLGTSGRLADLPGLASVTTGRRGIGVPVDRARRKGLSAHVRNIDQETDGHGIDLIAASVDIGGLLFGGDGLGPDLGPPGRADAVGGLVEKGDRQDDRVSATARFDADGKATGQADPVVTGLSGRSGFVQDRSVTRGEAVVRGDQTGHVCSVKG
jgi:hypothetical protein